MNPEPHPADPGHDIPHDLKRPKATTVIVALLLLAVVLGAMFFLGYEPRRKLAAETNADATDRAALVPRLSVALPKVAPGSGEVTINCDIRANKSTIILARTNGYLKKLHAEIDDVVKEGQLLAEIDTPEVDAELARSRATLEQAKASVGKAEADFALADRSMKREQAMSPAARAAEDLDNRITARASAEHALTIAKANVSYAEAEVKRFTAMQGFEKVVAPYDGRITFRYLDVGALISPGDNAHAEIFSIAETKTARVIIHAPQTWATDIEMSAKPILTVRNYPGREFSGTIAGNAGQFDPATRTMLYLLLFPNPDGSLYPGMYGQVKLALSSRNSVLQIPSSALISNKDGTQAMVVQNGIAHYRKITTGRDFGNDIEVITGLSKDDQVAVNPQVQIADGAKVEAVLRSEKNVANAAKPGA
jgi:RND family efflux transporter MFP subunit